MNDADTGREPFLYNPSPQQLELAVAANHRDFFVLRTQAAQGEVHTADGVTWTDPGADGEPAILFPQLSPEHAGAQLDRIVHFYRQRRPGALVGCWSLSPPNPPDLEARLLARGFQPGWRPCWMDLELRQLRDHSPQPGGLRIEVLETVPKWEAPQLPYYSRAAAMVNQDLAKRRPRQLWHFVAFLADELVGQSTLFITSGALGVAGIYDVGVVPTVRNQGIGKAVTAAACRKALALGCSHALLNATGERMYRQLGFERIGYGRTWWLNVTRLNVRPPSPERIMMAEAVARGDVGALVVLFERDTETLDIPLTNGMTLLELAAHTRQPASAEWLLEHGATPDVVVAWDLGWKDRMLALLAKHPMLVNRQRGESATTPLHEAVERDDLALAAVLLAAKPNLAIKDAMYSGTPLDWAKHMRRTAIIELIERYQAAQ